MAQKTIRSLARSMSNPEASSSSQRPNRPGVIVHLCHDLQTQDRRSTEFIFFEPRSEGYLAEEICMDVCRTRCIGAYTFHIFALATTDLKVWLSPSQLITFDSPETYEFVFRVRFKPHENNFVRIINISPQTFDYYFLQCREDFVKDHLKEVLDDVKQNDILGLAIMDMLRFGKEYDIDYSGMKKYEPEMFLPPSAVRAFRMPLSKHRLEASFKNKLKKEFQEGEKDGSSVLDIKWSYMRALWKYVVTDNKERGVAKDLYGAEHFCLASGDEVVVDPHHPSLPGIYTRCKTKGVPEHFCKIEDLVDVSILGETNIPGQFLVQVNRTSGIPQHFMFASMGLAQSFASCLDGYFRLIVDYHQHVCTKIHSNMLKQLKELRCHGPVDNGWAVRRLHQKSEEMPKENYNYLLKQRRDDLDMYRIVLLNPPDKMPPCISINKLQDGQFQLAMPYEQIFPSVRDLLAYYSSGQHEKIKLQRILRPTRPYDNTLFLCREIVREGDETGNKRKQKKEPIFLVQAVNYVETNIAAGQFTELHKAILERENSKSKENSVQIVISKQLKAQKDTREILQDFTGGIHKAAVWSHATIMAVHSVYMGFPFQVLLEYAELGSMDRYLLDPQTDLKVSHLIIAAEQLAQALCYLQEDQSPSEWHGNLRARNVLVFRHTPLEGFHIKLGDPGLVYMYKRRPLSDPVNLERLPWIPPESYEDLTQPTIHGDRYAYGVTLWEMFSCGDRPFCKMPLDKMLDYVEHGGQLECPPQCPPEIFEVMQGCWHLEADTRTAPMEMVRLVRSVLCRAEDKSMTRGDVNNVYSLEMSEELMKPVEKPVNMHPNGFVALPSIDAATRRAPKLAMTKSSHLNTSLEMPSPTVIRERFFPPSMGSIGNLSDTGNSQTPLLRHHNDSPLTLSPSSPGWSAGSHQTTITQAWSVSMSGCSQHTTTTQLDDDKSAADSTVPLPSFPLTPPYKYGPTERRMSTSASGVQARQLPELPSYIIPSSKLFVNDKKELGSGFYGEVYEGLLNSDQVIQVAVKRLRPEMYHKYQQEFDNEFRTMIRVQHPNCVRIIGQCINKDKNNPMLLVMEYVKKGCLLAFLRHNARYLKDMRPKLLKFTMEICEGMTYLASQKIVHRDLAARNVLVTEDDHMKISDFGLSRVLGMDRDYYRCGTSKEIPIKWCAPEAIEYRMFSEKSDIWSFGITAWEIFTLGESPRLCTDDHNLIQYLKKNKRLQQPEGCSEQLYAIMLQCWHYEPDPRPVFKDINDQLTKLIAIHNET